MKYLFLFLLCGCSYVHEFGQIGSHRLYKIQVGSLAAPGQTAIGMLDTNTGIVTFTSPIGGNGVVGSVVTAGGSVAMGYYIGKGLGKSGDQTTINTDLANEVTSNPVINIPDPPPAPPIRRPPFKWGQTK